MGLYYFYIHNYAISQKQLASRVEGKKPNLAPYVFIPVQYFRLHTLLARTSNNLHSTLQRTRSWRSDSAGILFTKPLMNCNDFSKPLDRVSLSKQSLN